MGLREVTSEHRAKELSEDGLQIHRVWELSVLGSIFLLERYGSMCGWSQIKLIRGKEEVYKIVRNWGDEERREFFFGQPARAYTGNQFSFVEYIAQIAEHERLPPAEEFVQSGLDRKIEKLYRNNLQQILNQTRPSVTNSAS